MNSLTNSAASTQDPYFRHRLLDPDPDPSAGDNESIPTLAEQAEGVTSADVKTEPLGGEPKTTETEAPAFDATALEERLAGFESSIAAQGKVNETLTKYGISDSNLDERLALLQAIESNPGLKTAMQALVQEPKTADPTAFDASKMTQSDFQSMINSTITEGLTNYHKQQEQTVLKQNLAKETELLASIYGNDAFKDLRGSHSLDDTLNGKGSRAARFLAVIADDVIVSHSQNGQPVTDGSLAPKIVQEIKDVYKEISALALFKASVEPNPLTDSDPVFVKNSEDALDPNETDEQRQAKVAGHFKGFFDKALAQSENSPSSGLMV